MSALTPRPQDDPGAAPAWHLPCAGATRLEAAHHAQGRAREHHCVFRRALVGSEAARPARPRI